MQVTEPAWPLKTFTACASKLHTMAVRSREPVAISWPLGAQATAETGAWCARNSLSTSPDVTLRSCTWPSIMPSTRESPEAPKATAVTTEVVPSSVLGAHFTS